MGYHREQQDGSDKDESEGLELVQMRVGFGGGREALSGSRE